MPYKFKMPPEWAPHQMTLMTWPDNRDTWPGVRLNRAEHVYADILEALAPYEKICLLVANDEAHQAAAAMIQKRNIDWSRIRLIRMPTNDVWIRDYGPMTLFRKDGSDEKPRRIMCDWRYNAWGGKYPPFDDDNKVPYRLADLFDFPLVSPGMILEGGAVEVNGSGFVLTTESVLLNPNRNTEMSRFQIEKNLRTYLGVEHVIWLKRGLRGDDTDGHIDDLARFVTPWTIVTSVSDDRGDPNYDILRENRKMLQQAADCQGKHFEVIELPLPATRIDDKTVDGSEFVPASYANFYIANGCVLVPLYDKRYDDQVLKLFKKLFPDRKVMGIPCTDLVWGQGSIHCITQQVPAPK